MNIQKDYEKVLSIIIPFYNTSRDYFAQALYSIQSLQYDGDLKKEIEVILVDDCSNISYTDIIDTYSEMLDIKYIRNEKNSGAGISRQNGIDISRGEWIGFLDADDILLDKYYSSFKNVIRENNRLNLVRPMAASNMNGKMEKMGFLLGTASNIIRKKFIKDNNIVHDKNLRICEDSYFIDLIGIISSYIDSESVYQTDEFTYFYRRNEKSITHITPSPIIRKNRLIYMYKLFLKLNEYRFEDSIRTIRATNCEERVSFSKYCRMFIIGKLPTIYFATIRHLTHGEIEEECINDFDSLLKLLYICHNFSAKEIIDNNSLFLETFEYKDDFINELYKVENSVFIELHMLA